MNQSVDANQAEWQGTLVHYQKKAATQTHSHKFSTSIKKREATDQVSLLNTE